MSLMDLFDDLLGPLNPVDQIEGMVKSIYYKDSGVLFAIPRADKGGEFSLYDVEDLLNKYGIPIYGRTHDARSMYFRVKKRQATWAEYLLLHAGIELCNPTIDRRNAAYVARHPPGWMPPAWADRDVPWRAPDGDDDPEDGVPEQQAQRSSTLSRLSKAFERWLDE